MKEFGLSQPLWFQVCAEDPTPAVKQSLHKQGDKCRHTGDQNSINSLTHEPNQSGPQNCKRRHTGT